MCLRSSTFAFFVAVTITATVPALAQTRAAAEALFQSGREAAEKKDWITACDRFEESNRIEPAPGTILNIARCREELGQVATSWQRYKEAAEKLPSGDPRARLARSRAARLEPRLPHLTLNLAGAPPGTSVKRNGETVGLGALGIALPVDPGSHEIVVTSPGREANALTLEIAEGEKQELSLELGAQLPPVVPEEERASADAGLAEEAAAPSSTSRTWAYVAGGVGVVGLGFGAVMGLKALDAKRTVDDDCRQNDECDSVAGVEAAENGARWGNLSTAGFLVGAVGAGVCAYLLLSEDADGGRTEASVVPTIGGAWLGIRGTL